MAEKRDGLSRGKAGTSAGARAVFTIAPGRSFLAAFAEAILGGQLPVPGGPKPSPLDLPGYTILLPTRRAARALQEAFLAAGDGQAMLLPKIRPIAEGQEDLSLLTGLAELDTLGTDATDIPPAVSEIERRLVLTRLVLAWSAIQRKSAAAQSPDGDIAPVAGGGASTPAQAAKLAAELGSLIDMVETECVSLAGLKDMVPENFSQHWQQTLEFLKIVTEFWPQHLAEHSKTSAADRRNRLILAEAERLAATPPDGPIIVAGVTGSIPATVALMKVISGLPQGAIVLPGLDQHIDEASWQVITAQAAVSAQAQFGQIAHPGHPEHPQFGLKKLLDALGVAPDDVQLLPGGKPPTALNARQRFISEAMRPAGTTSQWHHFAASAGSAGRGEMRAALNGVNALVAPNAHDEAEAIALILREAAETPGRTAALISPDRLLARRVAIRLEAWGIKVDDSAGRPFAKTVPGAFLNLVADAVATGFAPAELMALLKHPLCRLGMPAIEVRRAGRALELAVFRAPYLGLGLSGVASALERAKNDIDAQRRRGRAIGRLWDEDWERARNLVTLLREALAPMSRLFDDKNEHPLRELAAAHVAAAEALSMLPDEEEATELWRGEAGEAASLFFSGLLAEDLPAPALAAIDYPDLYRALIVGQNVRQLFTVHPRLFIWGPFEARLQQADVTILGSLNEGTWPESADPGAWLNRPMRAQLGLPSPEEKIGYAAHDFTSFLGGEEVYLTRAAKIDGVPTVPSRWMMRIAALLEGMELNDALDAARPWIGWARARDAIGERINLKAPEPRPPVELRPRSLSVTAIEKWIANPYAIFASRILKLDPLPPLGGEPDAALRGAIIHEALSRFTLQYPRELPADIQGALQDIAADVLADYAAHSRVAAFWLPRFNRFAGWFAGKEPQWRRGIDRLHAELGGKLEFGAPAGPFKLTARADRFDVGAGGLIITDYKTGQAPSDKRVIAGLAPQLPLEAAIAEAGGFDSITATPVTGLRYIRATGGEPPGVERMVKVDDVSALGQEALKGLRDLVAAFDDKETPYKAVRRALFTYDYDDFAHLARVAEWAGQSGDDGGEA